MLQCDYELLYLADLRIDELKAENAKLRKENDTFCRRIDELCMENEKLRELVRELYEDQCDECDRCKYRDRMCELGIEV